jgi:hypothetical protein
LIGADNKTIHLDLRPTRIAAKVIYICCWIDVANADCRDEKLQRLKARYQVHLARGSVSA